VSSTNGETPLVRTEYLSKVYGEPPLDIQVVKDVNLAIRANELTVLMGPSGSGKTTLIMLMAGLLEPTHGSVTLFGKTLPRGQGSIAAAIRRHKLGFIFQQYNLFPALTALDNVAAVLRLKGLAKPRAYRQAEETLSQVGLADRLSHRPSELSGGQKQRVAIARALAGDPALIIGDEPTASLDTQTSQHIAKLMKEMVGPKRGVLLVTHDLRLASHADRILRIEDGAIVSDEVIHA
jgi:ABC-type lipoprotein export system ATPase subunit